jgi:hypothetical protein
MNGKQFRSLMRLIHLVGSALIGTFIYSPWGGEAWFVALMQFGVIPLLGLSGLAMWQQAWLLKRLRPTPPRRDTTITP